MTTTVDQKAQATDDVQTSTPHSFTVEEYYRMAAAGVFGPEARVELIDGEIIDMAPQGYRHVAQILELNYLLTQHCTKGMRVSIQSTLHLNQKSEPEPDVVVLRARADRYRKALPAAADVLLLMEVSDSTLNYDQDRKLPMYARAAIREVWIVNLAEGQIEIYTDPQAGTYSTRRIAKRGDTITTDALPGVTLALDEILV